MLTPGVTNESLNRPLDVHSFAAFLADKRFDGARPYPPHASGTRVSL